MDIDIYIYRYIECMKDIGHRMFIYLIFRLGILEGVI
jgi:hypothetical protein